MTALAHPTPAPDCGLTAYELAELARAEWEARRAALFAAEAERTAAYHARIEAARAAQSAEFLANRLALAKKGWGTMYLRDSGYEAPPTHPDRNYDGRF